MRSQLKMKKEEEILNTAADFVRVVLAIILLIALPLDGDTVTVVAAKLRQAAVVRV